MSCIFLLIIFYFLIGNVGSRLKRDEQELLLAATHDGLTKLYNHSEFNKLLSNEIKIAKRYMRTVSLLMADIDHFKLVNDQYGHQAGDVVLEQISEIFTEQSRDVDSVCRYGGEEFTIIAPETSREAATILAERIRYKVENHIFQVSSNMSIKITISIGVTTFSAAINNSKTMVSEADIALYQAKREGRNRVVIYDHQS